MKSVYSAVRTGSLTKAVCASYLKGYGPTSIYSTHLVPSDFKLSKRLKKHVAGDKFATDADMKQAVTSRFHTVSSTAEYKSDISLDVKVITGRSDVYHLLTHVSRIHRN